MRLTQNNHSELHATVHIVIEPADYQENVNNKLKNINKTQTVAGFRPGKAPFSMVQKKYEDTARAEEIEKIVSRALNTHIEKNQWDLLTRVQQIEAKEQSQEKGHYAFAYKMAWAPVVDIDLVGENFDYFQMN